MQTINNGDTGASVRSKLNANFTETVNSLAAKQDALVSGTNIKTVNGNALTGAGDVTITSSGVLGPYSLAALQALSTTGLVANITQARVTSPVPSAGIYTWRGTGKGWDLTARLGPFKRLVSWLLLTMPARGSLLMSGGMREIFSPPTAIDLAGAIVPITNDQAGLVAAIAAAVARSTNRVVLIRSNISGLSGTISIGGPGTSANPIIIASMNGAVLSGSARIAAQSYTSFVGLSFTGVGIGAATATGQVDVGIYGCYFNAVGGSGGFWEATTADNSHHLDWKFYLNEFVDCTYATYWQRVGRSKLMYNRVRWTTNNVTDRGLWFVGGYENQTKYNWITGGRVGIGVLLDRSITNVWQNNVFEHNLVEDCNEEGLSLGDAYGNNGSKCTVADRLAVASTTGTAASSPRIICNRASMNGINTSGNHAVQVISGSLAGRYFRIIGGGVQSAGVSIYLQFANDCITTAELSAIVGAKILVVVHSAYNVADGNVVTNCQTPIIVFGTGHGNVITNNWVSTNGEGVAGDGSGGSFGINAAIGVWGVGIPAGPTAPTDGTAGSAYLCLPSHTVIQNNYIDTSVNTGDIVFSGLTWETQANTEAAMDPIPHYCGGNSKAPVVQAWRNGNSVSTLFSEATATVTDIGGTFSAESLLLLDTTPFPT